MLNTENFHSGTMELHFGITLLKNIVFFKQREAIISLNSLTNTA